MARRYSGSSDKKVARIRDKKIISQKGKCYWCSAFFSEESGKRDTGDHIVPHCMANPRYTKSGIYGQFNREKKRILLGK